MKPETPNRKGRLFKIILVIVVAVIAFVLISRNLSFIGGFPIFKKKDQKIEKRTISEIPIPVKAYKTTIMDFTDNLPALGTIRGYHEVTLKFSETGYLEYVNFKDGEKVIEGDIIASLDQRESLLKLEYAKNEMEKNQQLYELGSITELKLNQSKLEYQSARIDYEKTNLIAAYDGYIGTIELERGDLATPSDKVGTLVNLSDAYVEFGIIEKDVAKVRIGQPVIMVVDSYPRDTFNGELESISPIVEGKARTFKVKARVTNEDEKLKAGMFGRVSIQIYEKQNTLVIPASSIKKKGDEYFVFIIHPDEAEEEADAEPVDPSALIGQQDQIEFGTIEVRPVQIAYSTPDAHEVKAGIEENEYIVADVQQQLEEKSRVEVTEVQENIF